MNGCTGCTPHEDDLARDHGRRARYIEMLRQLADLLHYHPEVPMPDSDILADLLDEPDQCTCTRMTVATLEETLTCPRGWKWDGVAWVHADLAVTR